jgi:serine protease Do
VLVDEVTPDSPAAVAGLRQGDVITAYNGRSIQDGRDLALAVADTPAGERVNMSILRDGRETRLSVLVRTQPATKVSALQPAFGLDE